MSPPLPEILRRFQERGRSLRLAGLSVFTLDTGPAERDEALLLLHGFPTSAYDWHLVLPRLSAAHRVILVDLPGHGLSDKPARYSYSLHEQADVVCLALRALGAASAHVVAHDLGTSVACELAARRERGLLPFSLRSLCLMNGSVHIELCQPTLSQRLLRSPAGGLLARLGSERVFRAQLRRILARPVPEEELALMWALLAHNEGRARLPQIIGYMEERWRFWERWIGALRRLDVPALVLWGQEDPVAVPAIADLLASEIPGAASVRLPGVGHYPQIEAPDAVADALLAFHLGTPQRGPSP